MDKPAKTLKVRIKDKHAPLLRQWAASVNFVWNYINELSSRSIKERGKFLSAFDIPLSREALDHPDAYTMDIPRTIRLRLNQIDLPSPARPWCVGLRHLPQSIPTVREEALSLLPLLQPLVVREEPGGATSNARRYTLLAGRRTLQLLLEKYSRDHRTWALCVANDAPLPNKDELELLDTLLIKLICRPDPDDLALIATALKSDQVLRSEAGRYVDVTSDAAIGRLVGMSRTAMHRHTTRNRSKGHLE